MAPTMSEDFTLTARITHAIVKRLIDAKDDTAPIDPAYAAESNKPKLLAIAGFFISLATIGVALRMYCRMVLIKSSHWDDYMICIALVGWRNI